MEKELSQRKARRGKQERNKKGKEKKNKRKV